MVVLNCLTVGNTIAVVALKLALMLALAGGEFCWCCLADYDLATKYNNSLHDVGCPYSYT